VDDDFQTMRLSEFHDVIAPDGSRVRILPRLGGGSLAHFELQPGEIAHAVVHRTVEEIWYVLSGSGEMWRKRGGHEEIVLMDPGVALTIPLGTLFQFRAVGLTPLAVLGVTMPPWPGDDEAVMVDGPWTPTVASSDAARHSREAHKRDDHESG